MLVLVITLRVTSDLPETLTPAGGLYTSSCVEMGEGGRWGGRFARDHLPNREELADCDSCPMNGMPWDTSQAWRGSVLQFLAGWPRTCEVKHFLFPC